MGQLTQVLRGVIGEPDERLVVGPSTLDDAGVVRLPRQLGDTCLVQTVDYFPPVVDDPWFYGAIAAANALSDVYAMGGRPLCVLNLAGFPKGFSEDWIAEIFRGGFEKVRESGAIVAGGHTVQSNEAMFGFAVTGTVDESAVSANDGASVGDRLFLTKPLGMGTMTTAAKRGRITWDELRPAAEVMATLNDRGAEAMRAAGVRAATDVTGFGLCGHGRNIASASGVTLSVRLADLPTFPGALELAREGFCSGAAKRGRKTLADVVTIADGLDSALCDLVFDAETSGGLLMTCDQARAEQLAAELTARDQAFWEIGECTEKPGVLVELV